jgi:hypothetical protein
MKINTIRANYKEHHTIKLSQKSNLCINIIKLSNTHLIFNGKKKAHFKQSKRECSRNKGYSTQRSYSL